MNALIKRLRADKRGAALVEFALVAPALLLVIMGLLDMTYRLYAKAMFEGAVQKAARDATLESGSVATVSAALDEKVKNSFRQVNASVTDSNFTFTRRNFKDFSSSGKMEPSTGPGGQCAAPSGGTTYTYVDVNNSNSWDDGAQAGQGGADDVVLYTAQVTYRSLFPVNSLFGASQYQTIKSSTVLRNQPYNNQAARTTGPTRNCT
ncbi:TadE/TadG family type IV pilus assembly protein [Sphingomonas sp. SUN039]|uniref:TadE/TadG family type IV pilus assembly protein n=1 Tax=Sphingomonas sp. SUN039 TaxID=2937787 RepID=UPI002164654D|nr:TadE family protein [Sphingomonas sp. SUN039]UVO53220.1 pilus assembly protein [Sphingomonas sp. SUN039]